MEREGCYVKPQNIMAQDYLTPCLTKNPCWHKYHEEMSLRKSYSGLSGYYLFGEYKHVYPDKM